MHYLTDLNRHVRVQKTGRRYMVKDNFFNPDIHNRDVLLDQSV